MSARPDRWRRIALKIVAHASWMLPGSESDWADAMRREIDYIEDDRAALRWAIGCATTSYAARLATVPRLRWQVSAGPVLAGSVVLLVAMALQGHASEEATPPAPNETSCDRRDVTPGIQPLQPLPSRDRGGLDRQARPSPAPCSHESRATVR